MKLFKHSVLISLSVCLLFSSSYPSARAADAMYCVNCGTEWTQLFNKATQLKQLAQQAAQLKTEISQYEDMLLNSKGLSSHVWGKALQDFKSLQSLMQQSKALAYTASDLDSEYASRYGTYNQYISQNLGRHTWQNQYSQWSTQGADNTLYTLKGLGLQASQLQNDQQLLSQLQGMATSAEGRMQAAQITNMLASQNVEQLMKLRELMMMQLQMQANYLSQQQAKEDLRQAGSDRFVQIHDASMQGERF
jgi:type IV secretion system protein TrbJ